MPKLNLKKAVAKETIDSLLEAAKKLPPLSKEGEKRLMEFCKKSRQPIRVPKKSLVWHLRRMRGLKFKCRHEVVRTIDW